MQDGEIVAAIAAGDPAGLAAAYDDYAPALYGYCRTLLSEPADAADAVLDTYLVAVVKLGGLHDPDRLRPWLYAVARNECFRRLRAQGLSAPPATAVAVTSNDPDLALDPKREELRDLVVDALSGLSPGDREVIELNLRHVLDGDDLADALGVSRKQAHALVSRARAQFEGSLGALLAARGGECEELEDLLAGWDGELAGALHKRVTRHLDNCDVCGARKRSELSAAMLLSMLPMVAIPASLREQVLRLAGDLSAAADRHRAMVARRAEPFDHSGFPKPVAPQRRVYGVPALTVAACAAVAAAVLLGAGTVLTLGALDHKGPATASAATVGPTAAAQPPLSADSNQGVTPSPSKSGSHGGGKQHIGLTITVSGSPTPTPTPSQAGQGGQGGQGPPSPHSSSPTPGRTSPSPSPSQSPSPGTLAVSPSSVTLSGSPGTASFTITASGGTVSYSIGNPAPGNLTVSPSAGTLAAGQSVTVSVAVSSSTGLASETDLTVNPGGLTVAVLDPGA